MAAQGTPAPGPRSDRIPPYSEEAERGVLGSAMLDAERVIDLCTTNKVTADSFHVPAHRDLFETLETMHQAGQAIDVLTVSTKLSDAQLLDRVGGETFLLELLDQTPTAAHAKHYIDIVRQKHLLRTVIACSQESITACYDGEEEADEILGNAQQRLFEVGDKTARTDIVPWSDLVRASHDEIEKIFTERRGITGIPTGFADIDAKLMGLQGGDIIILAARPSMGKTSLAMNIAEHVALGEGSDRTPRAVGVFSLEMSRESLVRRMICCRAGVSSHLLSRGFISKENHGYLIEAAHSLTKAPIYLDDTAGLTAVELRARARRMKKRFNIELIVIDYLQLMNYPQYAREGRQRETAAISGAMKAMAKELKVPVIVLSQLSRAPETRGALAIPKLSDLRDSGSIEQDADIVALLRRPCKYPDDPNSSDKTLSILDIAKHRNGPTGEIKLHFEEDYTRFSDRARTGMEEPDEQMAEAMEGEAL
jgi:replicative DNA helicase